MTKRMKATLSSTRFKDAPIVAVAAKPTDDENMLSKVPSLSVQGQRSKDDNAGNVGNKFVCNNTYFASPDIVSMFL